MLRDLVFPGRSLFRHRALTTPIARRRIREALTAAIGRTTVIGLLLTASAISVAAQKAKPSAAPDLPLSMTCPMHPDVVDSSPGNCPICKMKLVPVRLEAVWTCPAHPQVAKDAAGECPIDHRPLVQMTVALTWTCGDRPDIDQIERGTCPDGKPMIPKRTLRPHGNHNPQHGGQFFMAPDNFHHVEGAYPRARVFRLYVYDDYARPLPANQVRRVRARVVTSETHDAATHVIKEVSAFPLLARGRYFEARVDAATLPAQMTAKLKFKDDAPEFRFDFTFPAFTKEPTPPTTAAPAPAVVKAPLPAQPASVPAVEASASNAEPATAAVAGPDPILVTLPIPDAVPDIVAQLNTRSGHVGELIRRGDFTAVYVPAFQARDLAIALEAHLADLTPANRRMAEPAISRVVRTSWLLDAFGDLGNRQQITDAYEEFKAAVADVVSGFK